MSNQVSLGDLHRSFANLPKAMPVSFSDGKIPCSINSYRGFYDQLAIDSCSIDRWKGWNCCECGKKRFRKMNAGNFAQVLGETKYKYFSGYKGGSYLMTDKTPVWYASYGSASDLMVIGVSVIDNVAVISTEKYEWEPL